MISKAKEEYEQKYETVWCGQEPQSIGNNLRKSILCKLLRDVHGSLHDVGCGTCDILKTIDTNCQNITGLSGSDITIRQVSALDRKKYGIYELDIESFYSHKKYDVVTCLEVLEHLEDDVGALENIHRMITQGGLIVLSVPVGMGKWSDNDVSNGHLRRYEVSEIIEKVGVLFNVERVWCVGGVLFDAYARRNIKNQGVSGGGGSGGVVVHKRINKLLAVLMEWDFTSLYPIFTWQIWLVGRKKDADLSLCKHCWFKRGR